MKEGRKSIASEWVEWFKYNKGREFGVNYKNNLDKEPRIFAWFKTMRDPLGNSSAVLFILDKKNKLKIESSLKKWGEWMGKNKILKTSIYENCMIETLFIGFEDSYYVLRDDDYLFINYNYIQNQEGVYEIYDYSFYKTYEDSLKKHTSRINEYRKYFKLNGNCCFFKPLKNMKEFKDTLRECPNRHDKKKNCIIHNFE